MTPDDFPGGLQIHYSNAIPEGTFYLFPDGILPLGSILFQKDPWPEPRYHLDPAYVDERRRALDFLADLLDDMCTSLGLDPETAWREPKHREIEQANWDRMARFRADARLALPVLRPESVFKVTGL